MEEGEERACIFRIVKLIKMISFQQKMRHTRKQESMGLYTGRKKKQSTETVLKEAQVLDLLTKILNQLR